jgi:zona occludens toxin
MITLTTGVPGSGKTLHAVWSLQKFVKDGRRVVVNGIKDLAVEHVLVDDAWVRDWHNQCAPNDVIVVDEVQRIWPNVAISVKATEDIEKLHVHRHMGVDFLVITQHPQRMNKTIRDLVGRHVHVRRMFGLQRAMLYEWDHCHNPNAGFRDAVKTMWSYPRDVFRLYTSAELHTKPKAVIPKALYVLPVAVIALVVFAVRGFHGVKGFGASLDPRAALTGGASSPAAVAPVAAGVKSGSKIWRVVGAYVLQGRAFVLVADQAGRVRSVERSGFSGDGLLLEGKIDGDRVGGWTGAVDTGDGSGARK